MIISSVLAMITNVILSIMLLVLDSNSAIGARARRTLPFSDQFEALDYLESRHKSFFSPKRPFYLHAVATCAELPFNISTMISICFPSLTQSSVIFVYEACITKGRAEKIKVHISHGTLARVAHMSLRTCLF